jgi:hypothetical protein
MYENKTFENFGIQFKEAFHAFELLVKGGSKFKTVKEETYPPKQNRDAIMEWARKMHAANKDADVIIKISLQVAKEKEDDMILLEWHAPGRRVTIRTFVDGDIYNDNCMATVQSNFEKDKSLRGIFGAIMD